MKVINIPIDPAWPEFDDGRAIYLEHTKEWLIKRYGDFGPCICFLFNNNTKKIQWKELDLAAYGLTDSRGAFAITGEYWVSGKGNIMFAPKEDGEFILIATEWGGPFSETRGSEYDILKREAIYWHRGISKNKKLGNNYYVFERDLWEEINNGR